MKLDRLLPKLAARAADLHLRRRRDLVALRRIILAGHHGCQQGHRSRLLQQHIHIHRAMLQRLEFPDRTAELLALLHVVDRQGVHGCHDADRLRCKEGNRLVHDPLNHLQRACRVPQRYAGGARQRNLCRALPVLRGIAADGHALAEHIDEEQADPVAVPRAAAGSRGDEQLVGSIAVRHAPFFPL